MTIIREEEPEQLIRNKTTGKTSITKIVKEPKKAKSIDGHLFGVSKELKALFVEINERILQISDEIERYTTNAEIVYKTSLNFAYVALQKKNNALRILLRSTNGQIKDPLSLTERIPKTHGYGKITHQMHISPKKEDSEKFLDDIMDVIFQAYSATQ
jgi:predicted transport protein